MPPVIVVDTRERQPYSFEKCSTIRAKLDYGDYSIQGYEHHVAFERKNMDDYVQSVIAQRERFFNEIKELSHYEYRGILVECSAEDIIDKKYTSGANPLSIVGATTSLICDFNMPVYFLSTRQIARLFLEDTLLRIHKRLKQ